MATINTPKFRVSYPTVFKARKNDLNGKDEYSVQALFAPDADLTMLKKALEKAIVDMWGADKAKWPKNLRNPFRDQGDRAKDVNGKMVLPNGYVEGAKYLNLKSTKKPAVVDKNVQAIIDEPEFYAGCYAIASVNSYAYDQLGNKGVSFGLVNIQKVADGEPFGNRTTPEQDFAPIDSGDGDAGDLFS